MKNTLNMDNYKYDLLIKIPIDDKLSIDITEKLGFIEYRYRSTNNSPLTNYRLYVINMKLVERFVKLEKIIDRKEKSMTIFTGVIQKYKVRIV